MREMIKVKQCFLDNFYIDDSVWLNNDCIFLFRYILSLSTNEYNTINSLYPNLNQMFTHYWQTIGDGILLMLDEDFTNKYGDRWSSRFLYNLSKSKASLVLVPTDMKKYRLRNLWYYLLFKYGRKWDGLCSAFLLEYNPIHNYDMEEDEKYNTYLETSDNTDNYTNGFNSSTASPTDKSENTVTVDGDWDNNKRNLKRSGNIGVTTTQKMLQEEIEIKRYNILNEMFEDIASELTLSIY